MSILSLTYQQSVFQCYHSDKHLLVFTYNMATEINWLRYGTKLRHCHPMYRPNLRVSLAFAFVWTVTAVIMDGESISSCDKLFHPFITL